MYRLVYLLVALSGVLWCIVGAFVWPQHALLWTGFAWLSGLAAAYLATGE